jgi:outer membrane protein assembly factor BamB
VKKAPAIAAALGRLACAGLLVSSAHVLGAEPPPGADDWLQFRGPTRNGISPATGLLARWPDGGPPLAWTYEECGIGYAGVVASGGRVLTAGTFRDKGTQVLCLDAGGKLLWSTPNGTGAWKVPRDKWAANFGGTRSTPAIAAGRVFHLDVLGRLGAFDLASGGELWSVNFPVEFVGRANEWGYSESVLVADGRLYCLPGGSRGFLVCLDAATGKTLWANISIQDTHASNASAILVDRKSVV